MKARKTGQKQNERL